MKKQEKQLRCVHYLNQFFGKAGGEEKANMPLRIIEGAVGPGAVLQKALEDEGTVVATIVSGDNYFIEEQENALLQFNRILDEVKPDLVIAGPAFGAGRYGLACAEVCKAAQRKGIAAVTAMFPENPGVLELRREVYVFPTREKSLDMASAIEKMVNFGKKLARGTPIGTADEEGYLPRGIRKPGTASEAGSKRAVDMLALKIHGGPFKTEIPVILPEQVKPAPPIRDISKAEIALVTTCGLVRKGNPDGQVSGRSERYFRHSIEGLDELRSTEWEAFHSGYYNKIASEDPNYILPLRQMRLLESEKFVGKIHLWIFTVAGTGTPVTNSKKMGQQMAQELVDGGVDGVLMTSAWGTCNRCGATISKEIERRGIPVSMVTAIYGLAMTTGAIRVVKGKRIEHVLGDPNLGVEKDRAYSLRLVRTGLKVLEEPVSGTTFFDPDEYMKAKEAHHAA